MRVILIPGTFANTGRDAPQDDWWRPGSPFVLAAKEHGLECLSLAWSTELDGVIGPDSGWQKGAKRLYNQTWTLQPLTILAHSHGGQLPPLAAVYYGLKIRRLITMATPVRSDIPYKEARPNIEHWIHVFGGVRDYVQIIGELAVLEFHVLRRKMAYADENLCFPECDHSEVHTVEAWDRHGMWEKVKVVP